MEDQRFKEFDNRLDKVEDRQDRLEEAQKKIEIEFAETKVYVKEIYKKLDSIFVTVETLKNSSHENKTANASKWEQFFTKAFWAVAGVLATIVVSKLGVK